MVSRFEDLKCFMDTTISKLGVSGIDCIIYQDHKEIFRHSTGFADIENRLPIEPGMLYNIYSATKVITCIAAMQLVERGKLLLSDPLYEYLPEYKDMKVKSGTFSIRPARNIIRIVDLFTMCAGISYELNTPSMQNLKSETNGDFNTRDFVRALANEPLLFEPGEGWNYSYCHDVLGAVIEIVSGMSFGEYLSKNIFEPLGMKDSGFSVPMEKRSRIAPQYEFIPQSGSVVRITSDCLGAAGLRHESGGGGLIMSSDDYILFADALACGGIGANGNKIISENTIHLLSRNFLSGKQLEDYRKTGALEGIGYGLGVSTITDSVAARTLVPENAFNWGGIGGVQDLIDTKNRLSYFVAQHTFKTPKTKLNSGMLNILYSNI